MHDEGSGSVPDAIAAKDNRFVIAHDGITSPQLVGFGTNDVGCFVPDPIRQVTQIMTLVFVWPNSIQRMRGPRPKLFTTFLGPRGLVGPPPFWGRFWDNLIVA